ncbi:MAG TPA: GatB/YqeY domain-containing protein [Actinopolymorphaceae bacterium]
MRTSLRDGLKTALKTRDRVAVSALRSALAAIENAEAVPAQASEPAIGVGTAEADRRVLGDADLRSILECEVEERTSAAEEYVRHGRSDVAERLRAEAEVLRRYLD